MRWDRHLSEVVKTKEKTSRTSIDSILARTDCRVGDKKWWSIIQFEGIPVTLSVDGDDAQVAFLWRDSLVDGISQVEHVYIDINGVTDHHSFNMARLTRIEGTDVWFYIARLKLTWRGGYAFIPVSEQQAQPEYTGSEEEKKAQHRDWLRAIFPLSCRDKLNPAGLHHCDWGKVTSPLCMPQALAQADWQPFDNAAGQSKHKADHVIQWHSNLLDTTREIWVYSTASGFPEHPLPLVLVLDGRFWSHSLPIYDALSCATQKARLPQAVYVLIDEVSGQQRRKDLSCNPQFWQAITNELLPLIEEKFLITQEPARTAIVGQSLGGLAAMYAALNWPDRFGLVVCQSGSFWWPDVSLIKPPSEYSPPLTPDLLSEMSQNIHDGLGSNVCLNIFMEVGSGEDIMIDLNQDVYNQLARQQHQINYRVFDGGHDRLCWRGGIIDGLSYVLSDFL